jgi:hypothetical protein
MHLPHTVTDAVLEVPFEEGDTHMSYVYRNVLRIRGAAKDGISLFGTGGVAFLKKPGVR